MVMPRSRSRSIESSNCSSMSRVAMVPVVEQPVRKRRLPVVNVGNDAEIASKPASHVEAHYCLVTGRRQ